MKRLFVMPFLLSAALVASACAPAGAPAPAPAATPAATSAAAPAASSGMTETAGVTETAGMTETAAAAPKDIVDTAVGAGSFGTLVAAVQAAGLVDTLKGEGPFTVFAPTEEAFAALPAGTLEKLLADPKGQLTQILLYHVVPGKVMAADVKDGLEAATAQGGKVKFAVKDGKVTINDANVVQTDIVATNGVIHVIDKVILPPSEGAAPAVSAPVTGTEGMTATESTTDTVAGATAGAAAGASAAATDTVSATAALTGTIPEVAAAAGSFGTLLTAVKAAGLDTTLSGEGPFTVFAPTDAAFAAIPADTLKTLLADPKGQLSQILLYHVVPGKVMAADVKDGLEAATAQGAKLKFTVNPDGSVQIGNVKVIQTDIQATNGVIHVIDGVLMPPAQ